MAVWKNSSLRRKITVGAAALTAAATLAAAGVFAGANLASAAPAVDRGIQFRGVTVVTETVPSNFTSTGWTDVVSQVIVPDVTKLVIVRFSAESSCQGTGWCAARVLVDNFEAKPVQGTDFAFDSPGDDWASHSMEKVQLVGGGNVSRVVKVQVAMVSGANLRLDDWTLSIWEINQF